MHLNSFGYLGQPPANAAQAHDEECFAAQLIFALVWIANHFAPEAALLVVTPAVDVAGEGQHVCQCMFADGVTVGPRSTCQPKAALLQGGHIILVRTSADRLHIAQARRVRQQLVVPHAGDDEDVGLVQLLL
jgi:hypothetical protein